MHLNPAAVTKLVAMAFALGFAGEPLPGTAVHGYQPVVEIEIKTFTFERDTIRVEPGTTLRWINRDPVGHTSTAENGEWESPLLGPGESFEVRFDEEGTFPYFCTLHPFMRGMVIVEPGRGGQRRAGLTLTIQVQGPNQEEL